MACREITIGIPVEKGERHPAIGSDLIFGCNIRKELEGSRLRLRGGHTEIQGAAYGEGQLFIVETFTDGKIQVCPVQVELALIDIITRYIVTAIIKSGIEIDPEAFIFKDPLQ